MMRRTMLAAVAALSVGGCAAGVDKGAAEQAVAELHRMVGEGRYADLYRATAPDFRQATSEAQYTALLERVHALGSVRNTTQTGWRVSNGTEGGLVTLNYSTQFVNARAREDFTFRVAGGAAALLSHAISPDLTSFAPGWTPSGGKPAAPDG